MYRHTWLTLVALLTSVSLGACASNGQLVDSAPLIEAQGFSGSNELLPSENVDAAYWWQRFADQVLDAIVEEALTNNASIDEAIANLNAARALHGLARWDYAPAGGLTLSRERQRFASTDTDQPGIYESVRGGLGAVLEIDVFGRTRNANRIAKANMLTAESELDLARLHVVADVTATYHGARAAASKLEIRTDALRQQLEIVELSRALVEEGRSSPDILDRALAELASDEAALIQTDDQFRSLQNRLAVLLGYQPGRWQLPDAADSQPLRFDPIAVGDIESLLRRRPDIRMAEQALLARQAAVGVVRSDYFPKLTLSGFFGFAAGSLGDRALDDSESWLVAPMLAWDLLDFGRTTRRLAATESRVAAAAAVYERAVLEALEDAENAMHHYVSVHRELALRESGRRHALTAATAAHARYEEGSDGYLASLLARRDALAADILSVETIAEHRRATVAIFLAIGAVP